MQFIASERLIMRPVRADDATCLFRIYGDPATNTFNPAGPYPDIAFAKTRLAQWLQGWQQHGIGQMAIYDRLQPQAVIGFGGISLRPLADAMTWNLGYRFATEAWGKGLATEFCQRMLDYAFDEQQLKKVTAIVRPEHLVSQRVLLKAGLALRGQIADIANVTPSLFYVLKSEEWHRQRQDMVRRHISR
ncbi:GNAT family N-acetyltransferase [Scandinavium sp. V105_16]|uniref:GNAT family N-acetyltransferase n=1 Tax=Scandinavium lactucae TaxID=3095028 RepID=A0AAJ2SCE2_9ENTR|nr:MULTISPECIES: GNAT family N-acetyltransferase [unclassified Scandinavium]MDX6022341.1 GNAT family N-acetyltransferase [Scandinavium sp. V105_16]MDX6033817.1 GNAT family N-acetyltransferase [Scandinavium sp. V105_12]